MLTREFTRYIKDEIRGKIVEMLTHSATGHNPAGSGMREHFVL